MSETICGISPVLANRTIQDLLRKHVLQWQARTITITDWPALVGLGDFKPDDLRLRRPALHREAYHVEPQAIGNVEVPFSAL